MNAALCPVEHQLLNTVAGIVHAHASKEEQAQIAAPGDWRAMLITVARIVYDCATREERVLIDNVLSQGIKGPSTQSLASPWSRTHLAL